MKSLSENVKQSEIKITIKHLITFTKDFFRRNLFFEDTYLLTNNLLSDLIKLFNSEKDRKKDLGEFILSVESYLR